MAVLLPAAGLGLRLGRGPKALIEVAGRSLLTWLTTGVAGQARELIVAAPPGYEAEFVRQLPGHARVIHGGATRQETVALLAREASADLLLVHDAARPFLPLEVYSRVLSAAARNGAASAALPVVDTLVRAADGSPVDRDGLMSVQTPQAFRRELLLKAHRQAAAEGTTATDDAALVRLLGAPVEMVAGSPWLLKLTHQADLELAELLSAGWTGSERMTGAKHVD